MSIYYACKTAGCPQEGRMDESDRQLRVVCGSCSQDKVETKKPRTRKAAK